MDQSQLLVPLALAFLAGLCTALGSVFALFTKKTGTRYLDFALGFSAGMMIYISFIQLFGGAIIKAGLFSATVAFFGGMAFIMVLDFFLPHHYLAEKAGKRSRMMEAGMLIFIGIAIHKFPEGVAVLMGSAESLKLGTQIAFAIAMHNIPEGIAIAMPIYYATKSRREALKYAFLAGLAEPAGALVAFIFLLPFINQMLLAMALAFVGGIMVFISFDELLPICAKACSEEGHAPIFGVVLGMAVMAIGLILL